MTSVDGSELVVRTHESSLEMELGFECSNGDMRIALGERREQSTPLRGVFLPKHLFAIEAVCHRSRGQQCKRSQSIS